MQVNPFTENQIKHVNKADNKQHRLLLSMYFTLNCDRIAIADRIVCNKIVCLHVSYRLIDWLLGNLIFVIVDSFSRKRKVIELRDENCNVIRNKDSNWVEKFLPKKQKRNYYLLHIFMVVNLILYECVFYRIGFILGVATQ
jgi:hypothetical protein